MPATYKVIASNTLTTSATSITFSSIPSTYTDLILKISCRIDSAPGTATLNVGINTSGNASYTYLRGNGATGTTFSSSSQSRFPVNWLQQSSTTSNTFDNVEIYFPSYTNSSNKILSSSGAQENNSTTAYMQAFAGLKNETSTITSIEILNGGYNFVSGSSFLLYGISNS